VKSIAELDAALASGSTTAETLLDATLAKIEATKTLGAFLAIDPSGARAAARAADARARSGGRLGPLDGIPLALKDNLVTEGVVTTAGSKILDGWIPPYDGFVVRRLRAAGSVLVGKTNMDELGMGSSSERSAYGPVRNPWDVARVPGGSSGGSAVAVAARLVPGSLGSDTGGSVRQPAAMTGIYGLKPTYGRVSRQGLIAFASSLDQIGPMATTPEDLAILYEAIAGHDPGDSTSLARPVEPVREAVRAADVRGLRIGIPAEYWGEGIDPEVRSATDAAIGALREAGALTVPISLPNTAHALSAYYLIAPAEAASNLARFDGVRYGPRVADPELRAMFARTRHAGFGAEVKRRIMLGTYVLSAGYYDAYYGQAQRVRTLIRADFEAAFGSVDLIATPTSPIPAFPIGARTDDPLAMYLADVCTLAVNLAGVPALSAPAGFTQNDLPVGLQLIGRWLDEGTILRAAGALHARTPHARRAPPMF